MKNILMLLGALSITFGIQACSHAEVDKKIDQKLSEESNVKTRSDLRGEAAKAIQADASLTDEQKARLNALRDSVRTQDEALRTQSLQLRAVLIKNLLSNDYSEKESAQLKDRIRKIEEKRVNITFDGVDKANKILGHKDITAHREIMNNFFEGSGSRE